MSQKSRLAALLVLGPLLLFALHAQGRTWTDRSGRTIEADFVRLDGKDVVVNRQGKEVRIPLERLSDADQEYARTAKPGASGGDPNDNPFESGDSGKGGKGDEDSEQNKERDKSGKYPLRDWRDKFGSKTRARFIAVQGQDVVLEKNNGLRVNVAFYTLMEGDQEYVEKELKKAGTAHLTPSRAPPQNALGNGPGQAPPGGYAPPGGVGPPGGFSSPPGGSPPGGIPPGGIGGPPPGFGGPPGGMLPPKGGMDGPPNGYSSPPGGYGGPPSAPGYESPGGSSAPPGGYSTPPSGTPGGGYVSPPSGAPPGGFGTPSGSSPPSEPSPPTGGYSTPNGSSGSAMGPNPIPSAPVGGSNFEVVYTCSKCKRQLPRGFEAKAGTRCPHCNAYISYVTSPSGKREYARGGGGIGEIGEIGKAIIGFGLLAGFAVAVVAVVKVIISAVKD